MGYTITIGNATPLFDKDDKNNELYASWVIEEVKELPEAPCFPNDPSNYRNERYPSYVVWSNFLKDTGLYALFFDEEEGLMRHHPGRFRIRESDYLSIKEALEKRAKISKLPPGFEDNQFNEELDISNYDYNLARLIWLEFWFRWALDNCETPAIGNN